MKTASLFRAAALAVWLTLTLTLTLALAVPGEATARSACPEVLPGPQAPSTTPIDITYFGVSTLMFSAGEDRLLVDGFFSRPRDWLLRPIVSDPGRIGRALGPDASDVRAILTAHAHHDHALDTVALSAKASGARVVGTLSVARLASAGGVTAVRLCVPADGQTMEFGPYRVTAFNVEHGPGVFLVGRYLDRPMPNLAPIGPARWTRYLDNENLSFLIEHGGRRFLVHPSAGRRASGPIAPAADVVFVGLGRVGRMRERAALDYLGSLTRGPTEGPDPALVVPIHWDNFSTSPGEPLRPPPWPIDNVARGFERLCLIAQSRPDTAFVKLDEGARLTWIDRHRYEVSGRTQRLCVADGPPDSGRPV